MHAVPKNFFEETPSSYSGFNSISNQSINAFIKPFFEPLPKCLFKIELFSAVIISGSELNFKCKQSVHFISDIEYQDRYHKLKKIVNLHKLIFYYDLRTAKR